MNKKLKIEMAYNGYYIQSDIARFTNTVRQHVQYIISKNKYETILLNNRLWVKYDDGQKGEELYGKNPFKNLGFEKNIEGKMELCNVCCAITSPNALGLYNVSLISNDKKIDLIASLK